jgi:hypothetical protein
VLYAPLPPLHRCPTTARHSLRLVQRLTIPDQTLILTIRVRLSHLNFLQIRLGLDMLPPPVLKDCPSITLNPKPTKNILPAKMDIPLPLVA